MGITRLRRRGVSSSAALLLYSLVAAEVASQQRLDSLANTLAGQPFYRVGTADGSACETFGRVDDALVSSSGQLFILDARSATVVVFNASGRCLHRIGGAGGGPGELSSPQRLLLSETGSLHVLDPGNARIERFTVRDSAVQRLPSIPLPVRLTDFCMVGQRLFALSPIETNVVYELSAQGRVIRSFGSLTDRNDGALRVLMRPGRLVCHGPTRSVVVVGHQMPDVRVYSLDGDLRFARTIPGFRPLEVLERGGAVVGYGPPKDGRLYQTAAAVELDDRSVLIQFGGPTDAGFLGVSSVLLRPATGEIVAVGEELPHLFALGERYLVAAAHAYPVPRAAVFRR